MRNFINISDHSSNDLRAIIDEAKARKLKRQNLNKSAPDEDKPFEGKSMAMIFEKPSTRTRMSFEIAIKQLGGSCITLNPEVIHYGKGDESLKDTAKVLTEYVDIVMLRTSLHKNLEEFGKHLKIPIINGLSDLSHPCQIMSDILTFEETKGEIKDKVISWLGDGNNNMSNSLIEAAGKFGFKLQIGCPNKYTPNKNILSWAKKNNVNLLITKNPHEAVNRARTLLGQTGYNPLTRNCEHYARWACDGDWKSDQVAGAANVAKLGFLGIFGVAGLCYLIYDKIRRR